MEENSFAELTRQLIKALSNPPGELVPRVELAKRIGKKRLNPRDVTALDALVEQGKVERIKVETVTSPIGYRFDYRLKI